MLNIMSLPITTESSTVMSDLNNQINVQNERDQGVSHTIGRSKVPQMVINSERSRDNPKSPNLT